ncbi:MAG TPA: YceI family protein [Burkholderiaceae bacterium]|jgi:hypothetical protein
MKYLRFDVVRWIYVTTLAAAFVTGCSTTPPPQETPSAISPLPAEFPESYYRQTEAMGKTVMRITPELSLVTIEVRRAGTLARLGHDHVIASHDINGYVAPDEGRADLILPLAKLTVDEPNLRAEAGFDTQPTPEAVEGTRHNMLVKVLEADRFPFVLIHATRIDATQPALHVSITLHGVTRTFDVPAQIETAPKRLIVAGRLTLNQTDFGIVPYSVLGGAIQVQDRMDLRFRIVAKQR